MKKNTLPTLLILMVLLYPRLQAQVDPSIDQKLTDLFFTDSLNGWVVGDSGFIAYSTDGGFSWTKSVSGVSDRLSTLFFVDSINGWIGGENGVILMTKDGGNSWQASPSNTTEAISDLEFANGRIGWFSDGKGAHKTTDGGVSWNQQIDNLNIKFLSVLDSNRVWFLENVWSVYMSNNGGDSLKHVLAGFVHVGICGFWEEDFDMANDSTGLIVGTFWCYDLINGGIDYSALMIGLESIDSLIWMPFGMDGIVSPPLDAVQFVTDEKVWAVGEDGTIIKSNNGGTNWTHQESGTVYDLFAVSFIDTLRGWVLSENNIVLNTNDGGENWQIIIAPQNSSPKITLPETITLLYPFPDTLIMSDYVYDLDDRDSLHTWEKLGCLDGEGNVLCSDIEFYFRNDTLILDYIGIGVDFRDITFIVSDSGGLRDTAVVKFVLLGLEGTSGTRSIPSKYTLSQNYPNPFNPVTTIQYSIPKTTIVNLVIFNLQGKEIVSLIAGVQAAGNHTAIWDASNLPSGIYFYRLQASLTSVWRAGDFVQTKKMVLLK